MHGRTKLVILAMLASLMPAAWATQVMKCSKNEPSPLDVRILNCNASPCDVYKERDITFEIDFVATKFLSHIKTEVKVKTFGLLFPYLLPDDVADVCSNLMWEAYCPLYKTEDVTYLFRFPVSNYPEISVKLEIHLVDDDGVSVTCFMTEIKVKSPMTADASNTTLYQVIF